MLRADRRSGDDEPRGLRLDGVEKTIWLTRPDLRETFGDDHAGFRWWLLLNGAGEYRALAEREPAVPEEMLIGPAPEALPQVRPTFTRFMRTVWSLRPDLQAAFDVGTPAGQQGMVWWYFIHGLGELGLGRFLTEAQRRELNAPAPEMPHTGFVPLTRLVLELWRRRPDLQQAFALDAPGGQDAFLGWYFTHGLAELGLAGTVDEDQARALLSPSPGAPRVARILSLIRAVDPALRARFPDPATDAFRAWARSAEGMKTYPVLARLGELGGGQRPERRRTHRAPAALPFGVNLVGYARGQLGIGEDVRMAALALEAAGVPFSVYNVEPGREVEQAEQGLSARISDALPYAVNLFCTTGIETARLAAVEGSRLFDGRRSIGYWPWELSEWPGDWRHAYDLVDEVWASSRYTYEAYGRSAPVPVRHMPMAVTVDATAGMTRGDFRLPGNRFLFVFSFDFLSSLARKNPGACVEAFRRAFPRGDEPVGLVVKAMRATPDNPLWQALLAEARADGRITIISATLARGELLDLYRACDCFVSLHRSEGFGRGIAEAMMLGKPALVTGHSGNLDFTVPGTAALVDHRPRRVAGEDYPFGAGQLWAEPDTDHAAWWMRHLAADGELRDRLAQAGRRLTVSTYAPAVVGAFYSSVLRSRVAASAPDHTTCKRA